MLKLRGGDLAPATLAPTMLAQFRSYRPSICADLVPAATRCSTGFATSEHAKQRISIRSGNALNSA